MRGSIFFRLLTGIAVLAALVMALGCGTSQTQQVRGLNQVEAHKLVEAKVRKEKAMEEGREGTDPVRLEAHGDELAASGNWVAALFQYQRVIALTGPEEHKRVKAKIGIVYLRNRQWTQAELIYRDLTAEDPDDATAWQGLGSALMGQSELAEAEKALLKAVELEPNLWRAHDSLGVVYNLRRMPTAALKSFHAALRVRPDVPAIHNNQGMSYLLLGNLDRAEASFRRAISLDRNYRLAYNNLGLLLARQGRFDEARKSFEVSMGRAKAYNNVGCFLAWQGDYLGAAKEFRRAIKEMPSYYENAVRHLEQVRDKRP